MTHKHPRGASAGREVPGPICKCGAEIRVYLSGRHLVAECVECKVPKFAKDAPQPANPSIKETE